MTNLSEEAIKNLFLEAHTANKFSDKPVSGDMIKKLYDTLKWAPTAVNASPARFYFITSKGAKEKLRPCLSEGNVDKTMAAPVTVIVATDYRFYEKLDRLFPQMPQVRSWYEGNDANTHAVAQQCGNLQAAYLILAARALGLDCGPMAGFDAGKVDQAFFSGTSLKAILLVNLGYGLKEGFYPRNPRLDFAEACKVM